MTRRSRQGKDNTVGCKVRTVDSARNTGEPVEADGSWCGRGRACVGLTVVWPGFESLTSRTRFSYLTSIQILQGLLLYFIRRLCFDQSDRIRLRSAVRRIVVTLRKVFSLSVSLLEIFH